MEEEQLDSNNEPIVFRNPVEEKDLVIQEKDKRISQFEKVIQDQEKAASRVQSHRGDIRRNRHSVRCCYLMCDQLFLRI